MDKEANNEENGEHAAMERSDRPMGSKKAKQVQQLMNAVSLAVMQLRIGNDGGNNNNLYSAGSDLFQMGLLEQVQQKNAQMQEQNICLSMVNCVDDDLKAWYSALLSRLANTMIEKQVCEAEAVLCKLNS